MEIASNSMLMTTFESMPAAIEQLQATVETLHEEIKQLRKEQPANEPPIDGKEIRKRLGISEPTLIRLRKRKEIPFLEVCGHYRYVWNDVISALQQKSK